jgi:hypothetical protein
MTLDELHAERLRRWRQTPDTRLPASTDAPPLIDRLGLITLFPVSPEVPNLFHAHLGDPEAKTDSGWDTPSGHVYAWRWELGGADAAFYSMIVRKRPTWVSWALLSAVLRVWGETRTPDELLDLGIISPGAHRLASALDEAGGALNTSELRRAAGFPTGKEHRAAYLKAVEELDSRLLLAKVFVPGSTDMSHTLVSTQYAPYLEAAERLERDEALETVMRCYLSGAMYTRPAPLARAFRLPEAELLGVLERLRSSGDAETMSRAGERAEIYVSMR